MSGETATSRLVWVLTEGMGPAAIVFGMIFGAGTVSALVVGGSAMGYSALWITLASGLVGAIVYYAGGKVRVVLDERPASFITRYTHWGFTLLLFIAILASVQFMSISGGFLLATTTDILLDFVGISGPFLVEIAVAVQILLIIGIVVGGFKFAKAAMASLVSILVLAYILNLFVISPSPSSVATGLAPTSVEPGLAQLGFAGIVGGAFGTGPIWYAYLVEDNDWGINDLREMAWDQFLYMGILFSLGSAAIYISAAATLQGTDVSDPISAAFSLEPIAGPTATVLFTVGLWAATITSLFATPTMNAYAAADAIREMPFIDMEPSLSLDDTAVKTLAAAGILIGGGGMFLDGNPIQLIVLAVSIFTLIGPIMVVLFMIPLLSTSEAGEYVGSWYLLAGLVVGFFILIYSAYITSIELTAVGVIAILAVIGFKLVTSSESAAGSPAD